MSQRFPRTSPHRRPAAAPDVLTTRITAVAFRPNKAQVTRSAIVRFGAVLPLGYQVLAWRDGCNAVGTTP
jgi:hypothetical protein